MIRSKVVEEGRRVGRLYTGIQVRGGWGTEGRGEVRELGYGLREVVV